MTTDETPKNESFLDKKIDLNFKLNFDFDLKTVSGRIKFLTYFLIAGFLIVLFGNLLTVIHLKAAGIIALIVGCIIMINFNELIDYIKQQNIFCLNLAKIGKESYKPSTIHKKTFKVFEYNTLDFKKIGYWGFDDTSYICTTNLLDIIYDEIYLSKHDVWSAEMYLSKKFTQISIPRFLTDKSLFINYNIMGKTIHGKNEYLTKLRKRGLI